ncbi:MAG: hypothetical protein OEZ59_07570, partial [Deltaproteobacteria bacterium]|nr:hypothetical protein [Deltaproteobacteria bacterium]
DVSVGESAGTATFTVTKSATATSVDAQVDYYTLAGTAKSPGDFTATSGTLTFTPASTSATVQVTINDDSNLELPETFRVILNNPIDASLADSQGTATISNDDPNLSLSTLDGTNGAVLQGSFGAGASVSGGVDFGGDGYSDVAIGTPSYYKDPVLGWVGGVGVVGGRGTFPGPITIGEPYNANIWDNFSQESVGTSVAFNGNIDGDGFPDLAAGGPGSGYFNGVVYTGLGGTIGYNLNTIYGPDIVGGSLSKLGKSVDMAGDFNLDGIDDLVTGIPGTSMGNTLVIFGSTSFNPTATYNISSVDGSNGFLVNGLDPGDKLGGSVKSAGDINGDGVDDLIVGAEGVNDLPYSDRGAAYVVFGDGAGFSSPIPVSTLNGGNGFMIRPGYDGANSTWFGRSVSGAGDFNGDGIEDVVIGQPYAAHYGSSPGTTFVIFGNSTIGSTGSLDTDSLDGTNGVQIIARPDRTGFSVSNAGDFNGDGYDDIITSAPVENKIFMVFGGPNVGTGGDLFTTDLDGTNGTVFLGVGNPTAYNQTVSTAGDFNGDGYDDVIIATQDIFYGSGGAYVVFGGDFSGVVTHQGTSSADTLTGTTGADIMIGGRNNDIINGQGGADVLRGGHGQDVLGISDTTFFRLDGGPGEDTLRLTAGGINLDLTTIADSRVRNIEIIDLGSFGTNSLTLAVSDLAHLSKSSSTLIVKGIVGDSVTSSGQGWVSAGNTIIDSVTYKTWNFRNFILHVNANMTTTIN